jgi:hypothetical protein
MHKLVFTIFLIAVFFGNILIVDSCNSSDKESENADSLQIVQNKTFAVGDYNFAILQGAEFMKYNKAIYHRGDEVFMVLENVGPFARGADSLNHAEMKLEVTDAIGQVITIRENLFGKRGHGDFTNNILEKPYASYASDLKDKPGKYSMSVTVFDLVRNDSIVIYDDFFLE